MKLKTKTIFGISILALSALFMGPAQAAPSECSVSGILTAGGMLEGGHLYSDSSSTTADSHWGALFGDGAALVTCDAWNFQADAAFYNHSASARGKSFNAPEGHFGGDVFWRDPSAGDFGFQASYVSETSIFNAFDGNYDIARGGLFGNYYLNDSVSLGANAHFFTTTHNVFRSKGGGKGYSGFDVSADAKYYVTPNFKFTLTGDLLQSQYRSPSSSSKLNLGGAAVTLQADYQFNDWGLTGFVGGRLSHRIFWSDSGSGGSFNLDDRQVFVGLTLPIGGKPGSMVMHDRTGPVNNTSTFLEKLPSPFDDLIMAGLQN